MTNEILRFVNVRKSIAGDAPSDAAGPVPLVKTEAPSPFYDQLLKLKVAVAGRPQFEQAAGKYLGSVTVIGTGTAFDAALHSDRDIEIQRRRYRVVEVVSATELRLDRPC